jgi:hypothetical protein
MWFLFTGLARRNTAKEGKRRDRQMKSEEGKKGYIALSKAKGFQSIIRAR